MSVRIFGHYVSLPLLLLMLAEAGIHVGAVYLAGTVRFLDIHFQVQSLAGEPLWLFPRALLYALVMLGTMTAFGLYGSELHKKDREYQVRFLASFPAVAVVLAFVYYAVPESTLARGIMALSLVFSLIFSASARALFFRIVGHDALKRRVLVIGSARPYWPSSLRARASISWASYSVGMESRTQTNPSCSASAKRCGPLSNSTALTRL